LDERSYLSKYLEIVSFRPSERVLLEERENPIDQPFYRGDLEVVHPVAASPYRSNLEDRLEEPRLFRTNLRDIERQRHPEWESTTTTQPTDWDIEASLSIDKPGNPVS
jgi:hypothetical protein